MYGGGAPEISCSLAVAEAAKKVGQLDYPSHSLVKDSLSFLYYLLKLHNEKEWNNQPSTSPPKTALTVESL